jgi:hypothetical protein
VAAAPTEGALPLGSLPARLGAPIACGQLLRPRAGDRPRIGHGVIAALDRHHQTAGFPVVFPVARGSLGGRRQGDDRVVWFKKQLRDNSEWVRKHTFVMDNATYRIILAGLHPEASKQQRDNARAAFERYEEFVLDRKLKPKATAR